MCKGPLRLHHLSHPHTSTHATANPPLFLSFPSHLVLYVRVHLSLAVPLSTLYIVKSYPFLQPPLPPPLALLVSRRSTVLPTMGSRLSRWHSHFHRRSISKARGGGEGKGGDGRASNMVASGSVTLSRLISTR